MKLFTLTVVGILFMAFIMVKADINTEVAENIKETFKGVFGACTKKITAENFMLLMQNQDAHSKNIEIKCFKACALHHVGVMKDGQLQMSEIEEKVKSILDATKLCVDEANQNQNECDVAGSFSTCMKENGIHYV